MALLMLNPHVGMQNQGNATATVHNISVAEYRRQLSDEMAMLLLPSMVFLAVLLVLGLVGNSLVFYVYLLKVPESSTRPNILALALFDLITCLVSIPGEILDIRFSYNFMSNVMCKGLRCSTTFLLIASGMTLLLVAIDRYQKICHPLKNQVTASSARMRVAFACIAAFGLSIPAPLVYANREIETPRPGIMGLECSTDPTYKTAAFVYGIALGLVFVTAFTIMILIYIFIGRRVLRQNIFRAIRKQSLAINLSGGETPGQTSQGKRGSNGQEISGSENLKSELPSVTDEKTPDSLDIAVDMTACRTSNLPQNDPALLRKQSIFKQFRSNSLDAATRRTTQMLFLITLVFVISFVPHILISILQTATKNLHSHDTCRTTNIVYNIFVRSYFLNTAANPFIYGFCSPQFRVECKKFILNFAFWRSKKT